MSYKKWTLVVVVALALGLALIACTAVPAAPAPAAAPTAPATAVAFMPLEPFTCTGGEPGTALVCTIMSVPDENKEQVPVTVTVPWQGYAVTVQHMPLAPGKSETQEVLAKPLRSAKDDFTPARAIIGFEVQKLANGKAGDVVTDFSANPMTLEVGFTEAHMKKAQGALLIGFWQFKSDKGEERWVSLKKNGIKIIKNGKTGGGVLSVDIKTWGDPTISTGP